MDLVLATPAGRLAFGSVGSGNATDVAVWRLDGRGAPSAPAVLRRRGAQRFTAAAAGPRGVVAVGGDRIGGESTTRMWFSRDGRSWRATGARHRPPFDASGAEIVWAVAASPSGFVAVGTDGADAALDGAAWTSGDGLHWRRVHARALGGPGRQIVQSIVYTGGRFIAGGAAGPVDGQALPVVWTSRDGGAWSGPQRGRFDTGPSHWTTTADVSIVTLSASAGRIVAASDTIPAVWESNDGERWNPLSSTYDETSYGRDTRLSTVEIDGTTIMGLFAAPALTRLNGERWDDESVPMSTYRVTASVNGLVRFHGGLVAVGGRSSASQPPATRNRPLVWRGPSVVRWPRSRDVGPFANDTVDDVAATSGGLVAAGTHNVEKGRPAGNEVPVVWTSRDGDGWTRHEVAGLQDSSVSDVAALGDGYVVVGRDYDAKAGTLAPFALVSFGAEDPAVERPSPPARGRLFTAHGVCGRSSTAVVVGTGVTGGSYRPVAWRRGPGPAGHWARPAVLADVGGDVGATDGWATSCAVGPHSYLAIGGRWSVDNGNDVLAWTSADGVRWRPLYRPAFGGRGDQLARDVVALRGGGFLIGGSDDVRGDDDLAFWYVDTAGAVTRVDPNDPSLRQAHDQAVDHMVVVGWRLIVTGDDVGRTAVWQSPTLLRRLAA